jgi:uncharacterized membrane protein YqhA
MKLNLKKIELIFEWFLLKSRLIVIFGVVGILLATIALFIKTTVGLLGQIQCMVSIDHSVDRYLIEAVDHYLLASVLLVFAFGLYELFIGEINGLKKNDSKLSFLLSIHSLDDLKERLGKVILLILIVALYGNVTHPDTKLLLNLTLMGAIFIVALALYLTHNGQTHVQMGTGHSALHIESKDWGLSGR